jgi:hypothetical protein
MVSTLREQRGFRLVFVWLAREVAGRTFADATRLFHDRIKGYFTMATPMASMILIR